MEKLTGIGGARMTPGEKHVIACCGYLSALGHPSEWKCPGCGTVHDPLRLAGDDNDS